MKFKKATGLKTKKNINAVQRKNSKNTHPSIVYSSFPQTNGKPPNSASPSGGNETILLAEDEELLRNVTVDILEFLGYTVWSANNGEEAVALFKEKRGRIDLLLFDVVMPLIGGFEAFSRICRLDGEVPLMYMTGYSDEIVKSMIAARNLTLENANAAIIQKPFGIEELGGKVRQILDNNKISAVSKPPKNQNPK